MPVRRENNLSVAILRQRAHYEPETGKFTRITKTRGFFVGSEMGCDRGDGRIAIHFAGRTYLRSRLAWFYSYGEWPDGEIDHVNCNQSDDRIKNLRVATRKQNLANTRLSARNTSGYKGVYWSKKASKWMARHGGKYLGVYECPQEAHDKYVEFLKMSHGEFARGG